MEIEERLTRAIKLLARLEGAWIFVEGKRDREALEKLGLRAEKILTISGNLRQSAGKLDGSGAGLVYVLTDLDRRGDELARRARDELESCSMRADIGMRKELAHVLKIKCFEDAHRAYEKIAEEAETGLRMRRRNGTRQAAGIQKEKMTTK